MRLELELSGSEPFRLAQIELSLHGLPWFSFLVEPKNKGNCGSQDARDDD